MKIDAALLKAMSKAGVTSEQIAMIAAEYEAATAEKRAQTRELARIRQQNHRARNDVSRVTSLVTRDTLSPEVSPHTPLPNPNPSIPPSPPKGGSSPVGFADFWAIFPNRVGRRDAEKAFVKALQRADLETILIGLRRYASKTDDRPWCNPATFLNQDRWADQPADTPQRSHGPPNGKRMNAVEAYQQIAREKGWIDEPELIPSTNGNANRLPAEPGGPQGVVVDLRRGPDGHFGSSDLRDSPEVPSQRNS